MTLAAFQSALARLTASPDLCRAIRASGALPPEWDGVTDKERKRLVAIAQSKGMEANCALYRANRLAPVVLNCPELCTALGDQLNPLISAYWESEPTTNVHFYIEADRFCTFLSARDDLDPLARSVLVREQAALVERLAFTHLLAGRTGFAINQAA